MQPCLPVHMHPHAIQHLQLRKKLVAELQIFSGDLEIDQSLDTDERRKRKDEEGEGLTQNWTIIELLMENDKKNNNLNDQK
jgi:hypothetical protein